MPDAVAVATKPGLARELIARAVDDAGLPCARVVADSVYGGDGSLRLWLEQRQQSHVLAVTSQYRLSDGQRREWAATLAGRLPARAWKTLSCGAGSKGQRRYRWASFVVRQVGADRCRWLLARRGLEDAQADAFFVVCAPRETTLPEMVAVAGARWATRGVLPGGQGRAGPGPIRSAFLGGWAAPRHPGDARADAPGRAAGRGAGIARRPGVRHGCGEAQKGGAAHHRAESLPLTLPEVRRLLRTRAWGRGAPCRPRASPIAWSRWRRAHQARARKCHWRKSAKRRPANRPLQLWD